MQFNLRLVRLLFNNSCIKTPNPLSPFSVYIKNLHWFTSISYFQMFLSSARTVTGPNDVFRDFKPAKYSRTQNATSVLLRLVKKLLYIFHLDSKA